VKAIQAVGGVLEAYDSDKMIPTFGFGGCVRGIGTSHCFAINGNIFNPNLFGVQGIIDAYRNSLAGPVSLSGPTYFSEIIKYAADMATHFQNHNFR
jgi:hypothetical protein